MKRDPPSRAWVERRYPPRWAEALLQARAAHSDPVWSYRSVYNPADSRFQRHPSISALHLFLWCHRNPVSPLPSQFKNIQFSKSAALSVNRSCIIKGEAESCVARKGCEHRGSGGKSRGRRWAAVWGETPRGCENRRQRCPGRITGAWASQGSLPPTGHPRLTDQEGGAARGARFTQPQSFRSGAPRLLIDLEHQDAQEDRAAAHPRPRVSTSIRTHLVLVLIYDPAESQPISQNIREEEETGVAQNSIPS